MKKILFLLLSLSLTASAQFETIIEVEGNIKGLCNKNKVYALMEVLDGQVEAVCPASQDEIITRLNTEVGFCKQNPTTNDKGMIGLMINCKGEVVQCQMDIPTKSPELDKQIVAVFNSFGTWQAGKLGKKEVDSYTVFGFTIVDGAFVME